MAGILGAQFGAGTRKQSAVYVSDYFLTFTAADGTEIDLMAGAAVMKAGDRVCWEFDPNRIDFDDGLRWMRLEDWQTLYALFDRPHRISQIEQYLRRKNGRI